MRQCYIFSAGRVKRIFFEDQVRQYRITVTYATYRVYTKTYKHKIIRGCILVFIITKSFFSIYFNSTKCIYSKTYKHPIMDNSIIYIMDTSDF